jgi:hypothetical protein
MNKINKEFKTLLILWIVSIVISGLALYSFKDVKFKNTKKLQENNLEQQEIEQELEQEYQELLQNNQSQTSNNNNVVDNLKSSLKTTWELSIIIPQFFLNSGFLEIWNILKEKEIITTINTIPNLSQYKKLIIESGLKNNDIYLLPSNWIKDLELETIDIVDNPKPYFNPIFNDLITTTNNKYIPYSIDPIIILSKQNINIWSNRSNIFTHTTLRKQTKKSAMPLIRWIGKNDIRLLERWEGPFENYFDILYLHLTQLNSENNSNTKTENISELKNMLDTENIDLDYKYNFATFKQLYQTINKRDQNCELFPAICLMSYNFGDIKFWFLSDLDILDSYFAQNDNSNSQNKFKLNNFSNSINNYPIKWRIFVVNKDNPNINLANEFFKEYLSQAVNNNTWLRNNTLSAINNIYNIQKNNPIYTDIILNENNFKLMYSNINLQENFIKDTSTIDLLKWDYNPELYLK